ncbi:disease resistance protein UNI-like [Physcomitrium patens]|nr:uncharacterized protein LOC112291651 [Physcomitrium patens]|eukprot:XP_024395150.1 uncharacterized protein LOC112291651 [Physcomitrella patens]
MEMPDLEKNEATRLFLKRVGLGDDSVWIKDHDNIVQKCVEECLYSKGDDADHHYHPLSLLVLGGQLRSVDPSKWQEILAEEPDIKFNLSGEMPHPVFSIFERSYYSLRRAEQLLFMDVALFTPERYLTLGIPGSIFTWLSMLHNLSETQVITRLKLLNTRGMLEDLGDGSCSIRMHDLFREFAKWKAKAMNLDTQECLYVTDNITELRKERAGNCCQELARIALKLGYDLRSFAGIQWKYFSNVVVLKLFECDLGDEVLDLKWLKLLKSLDVNGCEGLTQLPGLQELKDLTYLRLVSVEIDIETLNQLPVSLKYLHLQDLRNLPNLDHCTNLLELTVEECRSEYPDLSKLSLIQKIYFSGPFCKAPTVRGLSSRLSNLQSLRVVAYHLGPLRCLEGLGELIGLQELQLLHVDSTELPDFHRFTNLKKMEVLGDNLTRLSGLGSLPKLEQIILKGCRNLRSLERLEQLPRLQLLHVGGCRNLASLEVYNCVNLTICLGLSDLTALKELHLSNVGVSDVPDLKELYLRNVGVPLHLVKPRVRSNFSSLKILNLQGCTELKSLEEMGPLPALLQLDISYCSKLMDLPDLSKSRKLELLDFSHSAVEWILRYEDVYTLASLPLLKPVTIMKKEYSAEANQKRKQKMLSVGTREV